MAREISDMEVDHPYYCNLGNYHTGALTTFMDWPSFVAEWGDADLDYNLVFRWDLKPPGDAEAYDEDDRPRGRVLEVFIMLQRKGSFIPIEVLNVQDEEIEAIRAWLQPRWEYLRKLWAPLSGVEITKGEDD